MVRFPSSEDAGLISRSEMTTLRIRSEPAVHQWSRIWKKNPNLENILRNPIAERAHFAIWNCRNAGRRGGMEGGQLAVGGGQWTVDSGQLTVVS